MSAGLKKEISALLGLSSLYFLARKSPKTALAMGAAATALYLSSKKSSFDFYKKSVLVTGGSRGLGFALAQELLAQGAWVTIMARKTDELNNAKQRLLKSYPHAMLHVVAGDITKPEDLSRALSEIMDHFGRLDVLINNAGAILVGPFASMKKQDFEAQMKLHFYAVLESVQQVRPIFISQGGGRIVNICSLGGKVSVPHMLPYGASKFALAGLSQGLGAELDKENIAVTTVYPTLMRTGSPIQAVFKGDHEKEFAWFSTADNMPWLSMKAGVAAKKILQAAKNGDAEVILSLLGQFRVMAAAVFPETLNMLMVAMARLFPRGQSYEYKTGAESRGLFDEKWYLKPFAKLEDQTTQELNQHPSTNAEFNLGLKN